MADHRKGSQPRRLSFDGRLLPRGRLIAAALAFSFAFAALPSGAFSQEIGLKRGEASLNAGRYEEAIRQLSATVNDRDSTVAQSAKALYLRGIAYRLAGLPGRAVSDLGAALWLGLPPSDKARALVNKGLAFNATGLSSQGEAAMAQARRASSAGEVQRLIAQDGSARVVASSSVDDGLSGAPSESVWSRLVPSFGSSDSGEPAPAQAPAPATETAAAPTQTAEAAPSTGWTASVSDDTAEQSGNAVSRWFGSLTGSSASETAEPPPSAADPVPTTTTATRTASNTSTATRTAAVQQPSAESWAANTQTTPESEGGTAIGRWFSRRSSSDPAPAAAPAPQGGGYTVQLANSRSQSEAKALWQKAKSANPQLANASPRVETVDIGDFGTFYTVKFGPFASQSEGTKICNALKRRGTDCSVISPDGP